MRSEFFQPSILNVISEISVFKTKCVNYRINIKLYYSCNVHSRITMKQKQLTSLAPMSNLQLRVSARHIQTLV